MVKEFHHALFTNEPVLNRFSFWLPTFQNHLIKTFHVLFYSKSEGRGFDPVFAVSFHLVCFNHSPKTLKCGKSETHHHLKEKKRNLYKLFRFFVSRPTGAWDMEVCRDGTGSHASWRCAASSHWDGVNFGLMWERWWDAVSSAAAAAAARCPRM